MAIAHPHRRERRPRRSGDVHLPRRACGTAHADHVTLIARANKMDQPLPTTVIARGKAPWQSVLFPSPRGGRAVQSTAGDADCQKVNCPKGKRGHPGVRPVGPRNDGGRRGMVPFRRGCGNWPKSHRGTVITVPYNVCNQPSRCSIRVFTSSTRSKGERRPASSR